MLGVGWASPQQESQGPGCSSRQKDGPSCRGLWMPGWCLLWRCGKAVGSPGGHALGGCGAAALCLLRSQRVCGSSPPPPPPGRCSAGTAVCVTPWSLVLPDTWQ